MPNYKKPRNLAVLDGSARKNPQRYRNDDRTHPEVLPEPPGYFTDEQHAIYREIEGKALPGLLTATESFFVELAAMLLFEYRRDPMHFQKGKLTELTSILGRLGFSPDARQRFGIPPFKEDKPHNPFDEF